ncbi:hypothetical protein HK101_011172 [Irineochytrium annulatum]|nr:hypothetical protein HK101_011172 [Irineochytrium annulatum]
MPSTARTDLRDGIRSRIRNFMDRVMALAALSLNKVPRAGAALIEDVFVNVFDRLDPSRPRDRYTLHSCLLVSRWFLVQASRRLWSSVAIRTAIACHEGDPSRILLQHALDNDPPFASTRAPPSATNGRFAIYFGAVRELVCDDGPSNVPPDRILPWLHRLDMVDARLADDRWMSELEARFGAGQRPRYLKVGATGRGATLLGDATRAVDFDNINSEEGDKAAAALLEGLSVAIGVTSIVFPVVRGAADLSAVRRFLDLRGGTLRRLSIAFHEVPREAPSAILPTVSALTHLTLAYTRCTTAHGHGPTQCPLFELLEASQATLTDLNLKMDRASYGTLRVSTLPRLESLELDVRNDTTSGGISGLPDLLGAITSLTRLSVTLRDIYTLHDVFEGLAKLSSSLKELTVVYRIDNGDCAFFTGKSGVCLSGLRKLTLHAPERYQQVRFPVADGMSIARSGLPLLEELDVHLSIDFCGVDERPGRVSTLLVDAILDARRTPAMVFARIQVGHDESSPIVLCGGDRSRFSPQALDRLRALKKKP